jgi:hypothetical protein
VWNVIPGITQTPTGEWGRIVEGNATCNDAKRHCTCARSRPLNAGYSTSGCSWPWWFRRQFGTRLDFFTSDEAKEDKAACASCCFRLKNKKFVRYKIVTRPRVCTQGMTLHCCKVIGQSRAGHCLTISLQYSKSFTFDLSRALNPVRRQ